MTVQDREGGRKREWKRRRSGGKETNQFGAGSGEKEPEGKLGDPNQNRGGKRGIGGPRQGKRLGGKGTGAPEF